MTLIAGIDVGTSGIKWTILDIERITILEEGRIDYEEGTVSGDYVNVNKIFDLFKRIVDKMIERNDVDGIGVDSMAPVLVLIDKEQKPIVGISYNSLLGSEYMYLYNRNEILEVTLNPPSSQFFPHKLLLLKKQGLLDKAVKIVDLNGYLFNKLFNNDINSWVQDIFTAFEWGLINHKNRDWYYDLIKTFDIYEITDKLPNLVEPTYGQKTKDHVYINIGSVDSITGMIGAIGLDETSVYASMGSTLCLGLIASKPIPSVKYNIDLYLYNKYYINGCNSAYATTVHWANKLLKTSFNLENASPLHKKQPIIFLPYIQGERAPIFDEKARGAFIGLSYDTNDQDLMYAVFNSLAYMFVDIYQSIVNELNINTSNIIVSGGVAKDYVLKIIASLINIPVHAINYDASAIGAALLNAVGNNMLSIKDLQEVVIKLRERNERMINPIQELRKYHERLFSLFKLAYKVNKPIFDELYDISNEI